MNAVLVYNPYSGSAMELSELKSLIAKADIEIVESIKIDEAESKLKKYFSKKDVVCIAHGGDGTLSSVAEFLKGTSMIFAPLPGGTLNHFTKDLGIDQDLKKAISNLSGYKPRKVDVASVNGKIFINNSSVGLYSLALKERDNLQKESRLPKWPAMFISLCKSFIRFKTYELTIHGEKLKTPLIFVGNNNYQLDESLIGERTKLDQGILSVYALSSTRRFHVFKALIMTALGKLPSTPEIKTWQTDEVTLRTSKKKVRISRDGEHELVSTPLVYKVHKAALNVLCPNQSE